MFTQRLLLALHLTVISQEKKDFSAAFAASRNQRQDAASSPHGGSNGH
jgi:hypothetical protein